MWRETEIRRYGETEKKDSIEEPAIWRLQDTNAAIII
jgi:hypothetical protein